MSTLGCRYELSPGGRWLASMGDGLHLWPLHIDALRSELKRRVVLGLALSPFFAARVTIELCVGVSFGRSASTIKSYESRFDFLTGQRPTDLHRILFFFVSSFDGGACS